MLDRYAPSVRVIDLLHEAPPFAVRASAHLLAALAQGLPRGHVFLGVVDPGVGSDRGAVVLRADGRWYVGPDNGLFSVVAARAARSRYGASPGIRRAFRRRSTAGTSSRPMAAARRDRRLPERERRARRPTSRCASMATISPRSSTSITMGTASPASAPAACRRRAGSSPPAASSRTRACSRTRRAGHRLLVRELERPVEIAVNHGSAAARARARRGARRSPGPT